MHLVKSVIAEDYDLAEQLAYWRLYRRFALPPLSTPQKRRWLILSGREYAHTQKSYWINLIFPLRVLFSTIPNVFQNLNHVRYILITKILTRHVISVHRHNILAPCSSLHGRWRCDPCSPERDLMEDLMIVDCINQRLQRERCLFSTIHAPRRLYQYALSTDEPEVNYQ